jgi:hypothetical protein
LLQVVVEEEAVMPFKKVLVGAVQVVCAQQLPQLVAVVH